MSKGSMIKVGVALCMMLLLVVMPLVGACAPGPGEKEIVIATYPEGGAFYALSSTLVGLLTKYTDIKATVEGVGPAGKWRPFMEAKEVDIGLHSGTDFNWHYHATGPYQGNPKWEQLRVMAQGFDVLIVVYTRKGDNIKNVAELKGKTIGAEVPGSGTNTLGPRAILKAAGITSENSKLVPFSDFKEGAAALIEGRMDAFLFAATSIVQEIDRAVGAYLVPLTPEQQQKAVELEPGFVKATMPKGLYAYPEAVPCIAHPATYVARKGLSEKVVYTVVKTLWEHFDEFAASHPRGKDFNVERMNRKIGLPVHPGTIKYLEEIGLWTKELEDYNKSQLR